MIFGFRAMRESARRAMAGPEYVTTIPAAARPAERAHSWIRGAPRYTLAIGRQVKEP
ncbi:hypothetical protein [Streptomyces milbemycinicus]|uniref:hypothetical protein n=1 Tax=Streptomyces milbemycinicus TaxID=476552 RepID=UPI0002E29C87|nr:hypothetical protein [Streptomyces milbemycinicus]